MRESKDRVRSALLNSQFEFPLRRITINLAPADLPKEGGRFDLAIALGVLAASGQLDAACRKRKAKRGQAQIFRAMYSRKMRPWPTLAPFRWPLSAQPDGTRPGASPNHLFPPPARTVPSLSGALQGSIIVCQMALNGLSSIGLSDLPAHPWRIPKHNVRGRNPRVQRND